MVGGLCLASPDECLNTFSVQFLMAGSCLNVDMLDLRGMPSFQFNKNVKVYISPVMGFAPQAILDVVPNQEVMVGTKHKCLKMLCFIKCFIIQGGPKVGIQFLFIMNFWF